MNNHKKIKKISQETNPYPVDLSRYYAERGQWPCSWVTSPVREDPPFLFAFRLRFVIEEEIHFAAHVTADERYILYVDGEYAGRGSEYGDQRNWYYDTYELAFQPGQHVITAIVWAFGELAPDAQISITPGTFLFSPEIAFSKKFGTGTAAWEVKTVIGVEFVRRPTYMGGAYLAVGPGFKIDGRLYPWGIEGGAGGGWLPAKVSHPAWDGYIRREASRKQLLKPTTLPSMAMETRRLGRVRFAERQGDGAERALVLGVNHDQILGAAWDRLLQEGTPVSIPLSSRLRIIVDLDDYYCAYPLLTLNGGAGATVALSWTESLFEQPDSYRKGDRSVVSGKYFQGLEDVFIADGAHREYSTFWWRCGRYLEFFIETCSESLLIEDFHLEETRYPLEVESSFDSSRGELRDISAICVRSLLMCCHETFIDCPYFEQLCYAGDSRYEALTSYALSADSRLTKKVIALFNSSRSAEGLVLANYPSRQGQYIPTFSLWWIGMLHDFALWRDDAAFVKAMLPGVRAVMDAYLQELVNKQGLVNGFPGYWNMVDWVPAWHKPHTAGVPKDAETGVNAAVNWQFVLALKEVAALEDYVGEPELAMLYRRKAIRLAQQLLDAFWSPAKSLFADDLEQTEFSEHSQCLALLSGMLDVEKTTLIAQSLFNAEGLHKTTVSFSHYYFEICRLFDRMDKFYERLDIWRGFLETGMKTCLEREYPSRSDCHGWGSTPYYHFLTTILGIRPAGMGFNSVKIVPYLWSLNEAQGVFPHSLGKIEITLSKSGDEILSGKVRLPARLTGIFHYCGKDQALHSGDNTIKIKGER